MKHCRHNHKSLHCKFLLIFCLVATTLTTSQRAEAGRFIALTETETFAPGMGEVIQVSSWQKEHLGHDEVAITTMQVGLEFGLASRFHVGLALPALTNEHGGSRRHTRFAGTSMWSVYNFIRPAAGRWGTSAGMAVTENHENITVDASLILEKSWSPLVLVMNLTAGKAWMREPTASDHGFLVGRLGASHDLGRSISLSLESEWCLSLGEYSEHHPDELRAGPSVIWNGNQLWALAGLLFDLRGESDLQGPALQLQAGLPF